MYWIIKFPNKNIKKPKITAPLNAPNIAPKILLMKPRRASFSAFVIIFAAKVVIRTQTIKTIINAIILVTVGFQEKKELIISLANWENLIPPIIPIKKDKRDATSITIPFLNPLIEKIKSSDNKIKSTKFILLK